MDLSELCFHLRNRRRMYLPDGRYLTAVAFVEGFNAALDGEPLQGFQQWLSARVLGGNSALHWSYVAASAQIPRLIDEKLRLDQLSPDQDQQLTDGLLGLIEEFIGS